MAISYAAQQYLKRDLTDDEHNAVSEMISHLAAMVGAGMAVYGRWKSRRPLSMSAPVVDKK